MKTISQRLFDSLLDDDNTEDAAEIASAEADMCAKLDAAAVPYKRIGWDYYDASLEIHGVDPVYRMSPETQKVIRDEGFSTVYVNHTDKWETHYHWRWDVDFKADDGWRVSYPHKRGECGGSIWTEKTVKSWPAKWFENGSVLIKRWIKP